MITYDYKIVRDYGDGKKTYTPELPKLLDNLVCIEGPNSIGKSTLLHLIALGCYGAKDIRIHPSLRAKMNELRSSDSQKVTFKVSMESEDKKIRLDLAKSNPNEDTITVLETTDSKSIYLSPDKFRSKYHLIYDIPDNPTKRLDELAKELREEQSALGSRVGWFRSVLKDTIDAIKASRDPKKIAELEKVVKTNEDDIEVLDTTIKKQKEHIEQLEKYFCAKSFIEYEDECEKLQLRIDTIEKAKKREKKISKDRHNKDTEFLKRVKDLVDSLQDNITNACILLTKLPIDKGQFLREWERIHVVKALIDGNDHDQISDGIEHFTEKLGEFLSNADEEVKCSEAVLLEKLIAILKDYENVKLVLPGVDKGIGEFLDLLEKRYEECKLYSTLAKTIEEVKSLLSEIGKDRETFIEEYAEGLRAINGREGTEEEEVEESEQEAELARLQTRSQQASAKRDYYRVECAKRKIEENGAEYYFRSVEKLKEYSQYSVLDESQRETCLRQLNKGNIENSGNLKFKKDRLASGKRDLERLKKQEPHRYQNNLADINYFFGIAQRLEKNLQVDYRERIESLIDGEAKKLDDALSVRYYEQVWRYLGKKIGFIRHDEEEYGVEKVDLIQGKVYTKPGKIIKLLHMGTGQGQAAYLKGVLNSQDKRMIIALIDEIAMMDSKSLAPLLNYMKKLYADRRLLVGIVVQRGEEKRVTPIDEWK